MNAGPDRFQAAVALTGAGIILGVLMQLAARSCDPAPSPDRSRREHCTYVPTDCWPENYYSARR